MTVVKEVEVSHDDGELEEEESPGEPGGCAWMGWVGLAQVSGTLAADPIRHGMARWATRGHRTAATTPHLSVERQRRPSGDG